MFGGKVVVPKINNRVFIDRDGETFALIISFLRNGRLPIFDSKEQQKKFMNELEFWNIVLNQQGNVM